jgi:RIO-like serine/threonine protein kinase
LTYRIKNHNIIENYTIRSEGWQMAERNVVITSAGLRVLQTKPMTKADGLVLWHLVTKLPVTGEIVSKAALEQKLAITRAQVSNTIKRLCEIGFLIRGTRLGLSYHYKLNPAFFRILS